MPITLTATEGPNRGLTFTFDDHNTFVVGRSPQAHFRLPEDDPYFSRLHFLVEVNPPSCRLVDLNSRNGTQVNGQRVHSTNLQDGDRIQGGTTTLQVSIQPGAAAANLPQATLDLPAPAEAKTADPYKTPLPAAKPPAPPAPTSSGGPLSAIAVSGGAPPDATPAIPGYQILHELGRGGMGVVYQARREADGLLVALKTILPAVKPTRETLGRFLREAHILRELDHPHIVRFRDMGNIGEQIYFAMDYVQGTDAGRVLKAIGPLPVGRAVTMICQLLDALAYAHGCGFIHRDIKPSNLLLTRDQDREVLRLGDFGLARTYQASQLSGLTMTGTAGGTIAFMPPEQVLDFRTVKPPADQYSTAASLYRLLTNQPLYDKIESSLHLMVKIVQEDPVPLQVRRPDLPAALCAAVQRGLAREPGQRYSDVSALRAALLPFA